MYMGELNEFFKGWKGSRIIARFIVASPGSSEALKGYYFNYVVPTFKHAIWEAGERLTEEQTERRLREFSPIMYVERVNEETGVYSHDLRTVADLSNAELIEHIETLKQLAAEEYNAYIDDPQTLWLCFASVEENARITRWRVGGLFVTDIPRTIISGFIVWIANVIG